MFERVQKRPADVISNVVHVMRIATGEIAELTDDGKNKAAVGLLCSALTTVACNRKR